MDWQWSRNAIENQRERKPALGLTGACLTPPICSIAANRFVTSETRSGTGFGVRSAARERRQICLMRGRIGAWPTRARNRAALHSVPEHEKQDAASYPCPCPCPCPCPSNLFFSRPAFPERNYVGTGMGTG